MRGKAEPLETGERKKRRVGRALFDLAQPRLDIAPEIGDAKIGPEPFHLGRAPQRGGADHRASRKGGEGGRLHADKGVAHVGAREHGRDGDSLGQHGRQVLHRMDGEIDRAGKKRLVDLLGEQTLAAELAERPVLDAVA